MQSESKTYYTIDRAFTIRFIGVLIFSGFGFTVLAIASFLLQNQQNYMFSVFSAIVVTSIATVFYRFTIGQSGSKSSISAGSISSEHAVKLSLDDLDGLPIYLSLQKPDHSYVYGNSRFKEIFNNAKRYCYQKLQNKQTPCTQCTLYKDLVANKTHSWEWQARDGRWYYVVDRLYRDASGEEYILEAGVDITDLKEVERDLTEARDQAQSANRAKSHFLANMSHEIRTPMNAILGFADLLSQSESPEEFKNNKSLIINSGEHLLRIIDDMLDISVIEAGTININQDPFSINSFIDDVVGIVQPMMKAGVSFKVDSSELECRHFIGDVFRIRQIIINFLTNAAKFTFAGSVMLRLKSSHQENDLYRLEISVEDTGVGISKEFLESIFKPFARENNSFTRKIHGVGLGLTIANRLAQLMNGKILVTSKQGEGSIFSLALDVDKAQEEVDSESLHENNKVNTVELSHSKSTILVVEDEKTNQQIIGRYLKKMGYEFCFADNGQEALEAIENGHQNIVLMDVQMPVMDGLMATQKLKIKYPHYYVIGLSAHALEDHKKIALEAGMNDYLVKPIKPNYLQTALIKAENHLKQYNLSG